MTVAFHKCSIAKQLVDYPLEGPGGGALGTPPPPLTDADR